MNSIFMSNIGIKTIISNSAINSESSCQLCNPNESHNNDHHATKHITQTVLIFSNKLFRVVRVLDPDYFGYIRLIINKHVREMTELSEQDSQSVFSALLLIERVLINKLKPYKINVASLGNLVPHLHWHIICRYKNDKHFPNPIWGAITNLDYTASVPDLIMLDKVLYDLLDIRFSKN